MTLKAKWTQKEASKKPVIFNIDNKEIPSDKLGTEDAKLTVTVTDPAPDSDTLTYQWYEKDADAEFTPNDAATAPDST